MYGIASARTSEDFERNRFFFILFGLERESADTFDWIMLNGIQETNFVMNFQSC
jgi:hypothetical protein